MRQVEKVRPTRRPKHERRTIQKSGARPQGNYTNCTQGNYPSRSKFIEMPPNRFNMPPDKKEKSDGRIIAEILAFVFGGLALMYAITWIYGHFRWGW